MRVCIDCSARTGELERSLMPETWRWYGERSGTGNRSCKEAVSAVIACFPGQLPAALQGRRGIAVASWAQQG